MNEKRRRFASFVKEKAKKRKRMRTMFEEVKVEFGGWFGLGSRYFKADGAKLGIETMRNTALIKTEVEAEADPKSTVEDLARFWERIGTENDELRIHVQDETRENTVKGFSFVLLDGEQKQAAISAAKLLARDLGAKVKRVRSQLLVVPSASVKLRG
jgi:hypothetical protein